MFAELMAHPLYLLPAGMGIGLGVLVGMSASVRLDIISVFTRRMVKLTIFLLILVAVLAITDHIVMKYGGQVLNHPQWPVVLFSGFAGSAIVTIGGGLIRRVWTRRSATA
jgi:hypothetical protein